MEKPRSLQIYFNQDHLFRMAPWFVSGASALYAVARAHQLSRAVAVEGPLLRFLFEQYDLIIVLCGGPVSWYILTRYRDLPAQFARVSSTIDPVRIRQMRQAISALMIGVGLLERRIARGSYRDLGSLAKRLHTIVRQAAQALAAIDTISSSPLSTSESGGLQNN